MTRDEMKAALMQRGRTYDDLRRLSNAEMADVYGQPAVEFLGVINPNDSAHTFTGDGTVLFANKTARPLDLQIKIRHDGAAIVTVSDVPREGPDA